MDVSKHKRARWERRRKHVRKRISGTPSRPRLSVFRSNRHIYCQLIDDTSGTTLAALSTRSPGVCEEIENAGNIAGAQALGKAFAELAAERGIETAVMDRGGYKFHGRVKALAEAAREGGLKL